MTPNQKELDSKGGAKGHFISFVSLCSSFSELYSKATHNPSSLSVFVLR